MTRTFWCAVLLLAVSNAARSEIVFQEKWSGHAVGTSVSDMPGWKVAHGEGKVAVVDVEGQPMLAFAANSTNTAIAATKRFHLGRDASIGVSAVMRDLPEVAGPAGVTLRGYTAQDKPIDTYWFLYDPGQKALLIKRGSAALASIALADIRTKLDDPHWTPGQSHACQFDVTFADDHVALILSINGKQLLAHSDPQPPARFVSVELLLFSYNRNDVAFGTVAVAVPAAPVAAAAMETARAHAAAPAAKVEVITTAIAPDPESAEARRAMADQVRKQFAGHGTTLRIDHVTPPSEQPAQYERYELRFDVQGDYANPFDPDQVRVDAQITRPDGSLITVPAFYMMPFEAADGRTRLEAKVDYRSTGNGGWRLRYAPTQAGRHKVVLAASMPGRKQQVQSEPIEFNARAAAHPGYVQVSKANPLFFENGGDGTLFYASGVNLPWTRTRKMAPYTGKPEMHYEHYFAKASGQMSATRVWQCHYGWIEWTPRPGEPATNSWSGYAGLNYYNQMVASAFDRVFEMAEESNIRVMLVLDDNNEHHADVTPHSWDKNPYNRINGGPCEKPSDIFTDAEARRAYRNRLRYVMARWGYSPALWSLNSWNDCRGLSPGVLPWFVEMHGYVHDLVGDWRPVIYGTNYRDEAQFVSDYAQAEVATLVPGKPNVIQEGYFSHDPAWFVDTLRFVLWSNLARGVGGVMVWPHPLVDGTDSWGEFRAIVSFVEGLPLHQREFSPVDVQVVSASIDGTAPLRAIGLAAYGDVDRWGEKATRDRFDIDPKGGSQFLEGMASKLYGQRPDRLQWRTTPTFVFDLPAAGSMILEISDMSGDGLHLVVSDNGKQFKNVPLEGTGRRPPTREQHFLRFPLEAGSHELTFSLEGPESDWLGIRRMMLAYHETQPQRILDASGLSDGKRAMLYIRNATGGEMTQTVLEQALVPVKDATIAVRGLEAGEYGVVIFDIEQGGAVSEHNATVSDGSLQLTIPAVNGHLAVKILPKGS